MNYQNPLELNTVLSNLKTSFSGSFLALSLRKVR